MPIRASVKVVVLCGGQGTRMREETEFRPKPMVDLGGRPILWHIMRRYAAYGLRDFVLCLGYRGEIIKDYFLRYHALGADFTVDLAAGAVECHRQVAEDWRVTLVDTGARHDDRRPRAAGARATSPTTTCSASPTATAWRTSTSTRWSRSTAATARLGTVTGVYPPSRFGAARQRRAARRRLLGEAGARGHAHQRRLLRLLARLPRPAAGPRRPASWSASRSRRSPATAS